jgi:dTDP-4-dehydrorhamnose 3,5-epimerase
MGLLIDKVQLTPLSVIPLAAGNVMHAMQRSSAGFAGFGEAYFSWIGSGVTKGWKRHREMTLNLVVPVGLVAFAVVDAEAGIGRRYELGPEAYARLTIPPGLWMAFRGHASNQSLMLNIADIEHDPTEADRLAETAFALDWNAPAYPVGPDQRIDL